MSFRTYVRNLKVLNLLKSRFLAALRNDTKMNCDTVSNAGSHPPCRLDIIFDLELMLSSKVPEIPSHKRGEWVFASPSELVVETIVLGLFFVFLWLSSLL